MVTKSVTRHPWGHHKTARVHLKHRLFGENGTVQRLLPLIDLDRGFAVAGSLCSCIKHAAAAPGYPLQNHKSKISHINRGVCPPLKRQKRLFWQCFCDFGRAWEIIRDFNMGLGRGIDFVISLTRGPS